MDIIPAAKVGIQAILLDRDGTHKDYTGKKVTNLNEFFRAYVSF